MSSKAKKSGTDESRGGRYFFNYQIRSRLPLKPPIQTHDSASRSEIKNTHKERKNIRVRLIHESHSRSKPDSQYDKYPLHAYVFHGSSLLGVFIFCHTLNPSPSAGRVRGLNGSTHLSPVHALHFGLADCVSTPAPRPLSTNTKLTIRIVYSRSHAFHNGNQTTEKRPHASGIEPSTFPP